MIPKIIHQTWKNKKLPDQVKEWTDSWKNMNPDFVYKFYTDIDCFKFIYTNYPEYLDMYEDLQPIERADVFRYLILHKYGGIYADLDTECFKTMGPLLELFNDCLITGYEYEQPVQFLQWFIACNKGCPIMLELVDEIKSRYSYSWIMSPLKNKYSMVYWKTGPELYTHIIQNTNSKKAILQKGKLGAYDTSLIDRNSYLQHYFMGSWK